MTLRSIDLQSDSDLDRILNSCDVLIARINGWSNSFQNMYDMLWAKVNRMTGKNTFCKKKTPKIMDNFSDRLTLEGTGGHTDDTRLTFRAP